MRWIVSFLQTFGGIWLSRFAVVDKLQGCKTQVKVNVTMVFDTSVQRFYINNILDDKLLLNFGSKFQRQFIIWHVKL